MISVPFRVSPRDKQAILLADESKLAAKKAAARK
jgi:hypothetical protein